MPRGVDDVHELSVRAVEPVPVPHAVEERTAGVQACDPAQPPPCTVMSVTEHSVDRPACVESNIASSLGSQ